MMKVLVSDRYSPVRERLVNMIAAVEGVEIVGSSKDVAGNLEEVKRLKPDVVVRTPGRRCWYIFRS